MPCNCLEGLRRTTLLFVASLFAIGPAHANERLSGSEVQIFIENDLFARTDRYYTNGLKIGLDAPGERLMDLFARPARELLDRFRIDPESDTAKALARTYYGIFLGQNMYTPRRIAVAAPQPFDRPWASWTYLGFVAQREENEQLNSAEIDIGLVGPASGGGDLQTAWHKLIDSPKPQGWGNQIPNELAFVATAMHKQRLAQAQVPFMPLKIEVVPHLGLSVGTVMTLARAGGMLRVGRNMTGFGPDTIEPGGAMLSGTRNASTGAGRGEWEGYAFVGADHRLVARNIFLDGTAFRKSASVDRRVHVYDLTWGIAGQLGRFRASLTRVRRSEEFHTRIGGGGGRQYFDSINIGYELR